jgi:outer membrane receptor protein involved in Fe transport
MKRIFLLLLLVSLACRMVYSQQAINGRVTDSESGQPLFAATVLIKETNTAAITDNNGNFSIVPRSSGTVTIIIRFVGYEIYEVTGVKPGANLSISLVPDMTYAGSVVVTGSRSDRAVVDLPMRVDVYGKEAVEATGAVSVDDYLRMIPGISVGRSSSFLSASTVSLRGMGNEAGRTLVMVDGVPVNKSDGGSVNWNAVDPDEISRIEVMKGPGSSVYGGNAMGGVINMITAIPTDTIEGEISQSAGTFGTYRSRISLSGRPGNLFWGVNGRYRLSDGYITALADEIDEYTVPAFLDEYQFGGRLGYFIDPRNSVDVSGDYYSGRRGTGSNFTGYGFTNDELASEDGASNNYANLSGRIQYRGLVGGSTQLRATAYGQRETYTNIRESLRSGVITRYDVESIRSDYGIFAGLTHLAGNHVVTSGVDIRHGGVDGADLYVTSTDEVYNLGKMNQFGIYVQDEIRFGESGFSLLAGIRYDYSKFYEGAFLVEGPTNETLFLQDYTGDLDDATFSAFSPRISMQYSKPGIFRVFAGYSRGFRAPVLDDMCRTGRISGGMKLANPDLKPEYLDNIEFGADIFAGSRITFSPTFFYSKGKDYHAYIATGDSLILNNRLRPIRIKGNIMGVDIMGVEAALSVKIVENLTWRVSYSYVESKIDGFAVFDEEEDIDLTGKRITYQPRDIFSSSLALRSKIVNASLSYAFKGSQYLDDVNSDENKLESFGYFDLYMWRPVYKGLSASLLVHNLFDTDFIDSRNMIAPGRMITFELKYSF